VNSYSEATIRARIKTVVESVTNAGVVHNRERFIPNWDDLKTLFTVTIDGVTTLRGWMISLRRVTQEVETFQGGGDAETTSVAYLYRLRGFASFVDADSSEITWAALVFAISKAIQEDATLDAYVWERETPAVAGIELGESMFAGVLCHSAELALVFQEVV
jgi:hypothetical protein